MRGRMRGRDRGREIRGRMRGRDRGQGKGMNDYNELKMKFVYIQFRYYFST